MNKHSCAVRMLAMLLCVLMVLGTVSFTAFADEATDTAESTTSVATLTELLAADKYAVYALRYADSPRATQSVTVDATAFSAADTTAAIGEGDTEVRVQTYSDIDGEGNVVPGTEQQGVYCPETGAVGWKVTIPESGMYGITIEYYPVEGKASSIERTLYIDGTVPFYEARFLTCTKVWSDVYADSYDGEREGAFNKDTTGNEVRPSKIQTPRWRTYGFKDSTGNHIDPFEFYIEAGEHVIQLEAQREAVAIKSITFHPVEDDISYEDYLKQYSDSDEVTGEQIAAANDGDKVIKIEGELYTNTSDQSISSVVDRTSAISSPQNVSRELYNAMGDERWNACGQWTTWTVNVPEAGLYKIGVRFRQNINSGLFSSRTLRVNGEIPFDEAKNLQFNYGDVWQSCYLNNGSEEYADGFYIYLNKGDNVIELEASLGNMSDIILRLNDIIKVINSSYVDIQMITGSVPDSYRDYGFYKLIPDAIDDLAEMSVELYDIIDELIAISGNSENITTLENIARRLEKMGNKEDEVAKNVSGLKGDIGSLGTWLQTAMTQPLGIDYITVQGVDATEKQLPRAADSFFDSLWYEVRMFAVSFVADYNTLDSKEGADVSETVEVWTSTGRDQTKIIRNLINNNYTPNTGVNVSLKLTVAGALLPSVLAGVGPDVDLETTSSDTINWAIRDALVSLDEYEGFEEILTEFPEAAKVPLTLYTDNFEEYNSAEDGAIEREDITEKTYGLPSTLDFTMMFYRADVFNELGLEVPKTWDEFYALLPVFQNNKMEVVFPTSSGGLNLFMYQMMSADADPLTDGGLYADNGRRINLDSNLALQAFDELCNLFTQYKLPVAPNFENQFRTGEVPLGIVSYTVYTQLSVFAPEIKGLWEFVPLPGWEDENGVINNNSVATVSAITMPRGDRSPEHAQRVFDFMAWYVGYENQSNYANEYSAWMGQQTKFNTANMLALRDMPWTTTEYNNLMEQFDNLVAIPEYPGGYIIARNVQFAFMAAYNNNANPVTSMLDYITDINKEISRKREEYGFDAYEISYSTNFAESVND